MRSVVFTPATVKMAVLWAVAPSNLVDVSDVLLPPSSGRLLSSVPHIVFTHVFYVLLYEPLRLEILLARCTYSDVYRSVLNLIEIRSELS
jgi:hypothetical protein